MDVNPVSCNNSVKPLNPEQSSTFAHLPPEVVGLFILNFSAILLLIIRLSKAERLIEELLTCRLQHGQAVEDLRREMEHMKHHKQRITIQENIYQKVLVQVESKTKHLTDLLESKDRLLDTLKERMSKLPDFEKAVSSLRSEVSQLQVKLESEVSSLQLRLSSFSSPSSSTNCISTSDRPETLYVHRTILPEKNVNDEFVHVPGIGLISTEELDQLDCTNMVSFDHDKMLTKKKRHRFANPLKWIRRKSRKELRMADETMEEERASFGFRSRL